MRYRLLVFIMALVATLRAYAQPYCDVRTFTIRDGLAANIISGFMQAEDGLMWFSTWNGLCYYDGYRFTTFRNSPEQGMVLSTNRIMQVKQSPSGGIWCCTSDRHVYYFDTRTTRFVDVSGMIRERFGHDQPVRNIYSLANGHTWLVSNDASPSYRVADSLVLEGEGIEQFAAGKGGILPGKMYKAELDSAGREWVFTYKGVALADGSFRFNVPLEYIGLAAGQCFFVSVDGRMFVFDSGRKAMQPVAMPKGVSRVSQVVPFDGDRLLLATNKGVVLFDGRRRVSQVISVQTPRSRRQRQCPCL